MESKVCFYWKFIFGGVTSYMICCKDFFFLIINYSFCGFGFWVLLDFFNSSFDFGLWVFGFLVCLVSEKGKMEGRETVFFLKKIIIPLMVLASWFMNFWRVWFMRKTWEKEPIILFLMIYVPLLNWSIYLCIGFFGFLLRFWLLGLRVFPLVGCWGKNNGRSACVFGDFTEVFCLIDFPVCYLCLDPVMISNLVFVGADD